MNCRRHGSKPTFALWMLVALVDVAILAAAAGPMVTTALVAVLTIAAASLLGARMVTHRDATRAEAVVRRRA
jgi:hypothetical protein